MSAGLAPETRAPRDSGAPAAPDRCAGPPDAGARLPAVEGNKEKISHFPSFLKIIIFRNDGSIAGLTQQLLKVVMCEVQHVSCRASSFYLWDDGLPILRRRPQPSLVIQTKLDVGGRCFPMLNPQQHSTVTLARVWRSHITH